MVRTSTLAPHDALGRTCPKASGLFQGKGDKRHNAIMGNVIVYEAITTTTMMMMMMAAQQCLQLTVHTQCPWTRVII